MPGGFSVAKVATLFAKLDEGEGELPYDNPDPWWRIHRGDQPMIHNEMVRLNQADWGYSGMTDNIHEFWIYIVG